MTRHVWISAAALATLSLAGGAAQAQQAGDWVVGSGLFFLAPQDASRPIAVTSRAGTTTSVPGSGAKVSNAATLALSATYFVTSNWGVELVAGVPPKFKLDGAGTLGPYGRIGTARQWSPAVLLRYSFLEAESKFRPFVGVGATYVWYSNIKLTNALDSALAPRFGLSSSAISTSAKLSKSLAPVFNVGASYQFDKNWGLSASISYIPLKTKATLTTRAATALGASIPAGTTLATSRTRITLNPIVTMVALTYRF